jgi:glyoxylase-like metal-dependent hydrolase (beta-lactamase superfamily II)
LNPEEAVEVLPGVHRIRVPQPGYASNYVYVLLGRVPTLIDAGHPDAFSQDRLDQGLLALGLRRGDLAQVLYTHTHLDHLGGGVLTWNVPALAAVAHRIPSRAKDAEVDRSFGTYTRRLHSWDLWLASLPPHPLVDLWLHRRRHRSRSWLAVEAEDGRALPGLPLVPGTWVDAGDHRLLVVEARGHDPHHICLLGEGGFAMWTGDVVLGTPTPLLPPMADDAQLYREALLRLRALRPKVVLPAHGPIFSDGAAAIAATLRDFDALSSLVLGVVAGAAGAAVGPGEVLEAVFEAHPPLRPRAEAMVGVLLGNVHSHLLRLARLGEIEELLGHLFRSRR